MYFVQVSSDGQKWTTWLSSPDIYYAREVLAKLRTRYKRLTYWNGSEVDLQGVE